ncbi:MAG: endonuclease NucS [Chloroflexota bacterium]|nr:endonuclease NucS [Chloroflexota bacterium]MDE2893917.1 endonuclease NucS [Chloroflexota bacterium]
MQVIPEYASEQDLEDDLVRRPQELLSDPPTWIARQLHTSAKGFIDLLGIDSDGRLVVYELKIKRTGRETMAQILDYASWIDSESLDELKRRIVQAPIQPGIADARTFLRGDNNHLRPARLVIVAGEANTALSRMVHFMQSLGLDIRVEIVRHEVALAPEMYQRARDFGVAEQWTAALETLDSCFESRGHRLRRLPNGINYEIRDRSGSFRTFAGVFINDRKVGRELGDIFLAVHDATIEHSEAEFDRLKQTLEGIGLAAQRGNVRMKFYAHNREDLTPALSELADYLERILEEVQPRASSEQ